MGIQKRLLVISFFYPPFGGSASIRQAKIVKYLKRFGWDIGILSVSGWKAYLKDITLSSFDENIQRTDFFDLGGIFAPLRMIGLKNIERFFKRTLLLPDDKVAWLAPAVVKGLKMIREGYQVIFSTSPPETGHLIGYILKKLSGLSWVVHFATEWSSNPAYYFPSKFVKALHQFLEDRVIEFADKVIVLSEAHREKLIRRYGVLKKFYTVRIGYDPDEFYSAGFIHRSDKFTITYAGSFYGVQMPGVFIEVLEGLLKEGKIPSEKVCVRFIGSIWEAEGMVKQAGFRIETPGYLPHARLLRYLSESDILLISLAEKGGSSVPNKLYEYMAVGRPILAITPLENEIAEIIIRSRTGFVVAPQDGERLREVILELYKSWEDGKLSIQPCWKEIEKYRMDVLVKDLSSILEALLERS
jgi:glycosyltransferase involved in cell wall biosynthesis